MRWMASASVITAVRCCLRFDVKPMGFFVGISPSETPPVSDNRRLQAFVTVIFLAKRTW